MRAKNPATDKQDERPNRLYAAQMLLLCGIVGLASLISGGLAPIPALSIQILVFTAAFIWVLRSREGGATLPAGRVMPCLIVFVAFLILSLRGTESAYHTLRELLNVASYLLVFLMVASLGGRAIYAVLGSLTLSAALVGVIGVNEYVLTGQPGWRVFSTFFNPDFLAGFMVLALPIALAWYLSRTSWSLSILSGLATLLIIASILMTGSRFGALTAVGGLGVFLILGLISRSIGRSQLTRAAILLVPVLLIFMSMGKPLAGRISTTRAEAHSGGFRIYTWKGTLKMAEANPWTGTGLGTFDIAYPKYALVGYTKLAHNTYLQIAGEAGIPAAVALIAMLAAVSIPAVGAIVRRKVEVGESNWQPNGTLMMCGLAGGAAASMARNVVDSDWYVTAIGISFWAVAGSAAALSGSQSRTFQVSKRVMGTLTVLWLFAVAWVGLSLAGEVCSAWGNIVRSEEPEQAMTCYSTAVSLDPFNAEHHRRLASWQLVFAKALEERSHAEMAIAHLKQATQLEPVNAKNFYRLARAYESLGSDKEARAAFQKALDRSPNAPEIMLALARCLERSGQREEALEIWERMVRVEESPYGQIRAVPELVEPEYIFAHAALAYDFEKIGETAAAETHYRRALDRAGRYLESMEAMKDILEAGGRRDLRTEREVEELREELIRRLEDMTITY